ncbi:thiolase [Alkalihalobacillus sp. BA299]|uniref:thiolase C-terminal domain-containing protein n=1 Tax=Alkalihalobacillus sp. BA299 TaxID=2815938 RepID=UPI001ADB1AB6|nr:thiolase [Alkalihalobacillus sp. BA299]
MITARNRPNFLGRTAIAGVGYTELSKNSGRTVLNLASEACKRAVADAGINLKDIDGVLSYSVLNDSVSSEAVATALGLPQLNYLLNLNTGGQAPSYLVMLAAMAIEAGLAENVLVFRALNGRSGKRIGGMQVAGEAAQFRDPIGYIGQPAYMGMWGRRFMIETGATYEDLAAVAIAQRKYAELNERAVIRKPLTMDDYLESPWIVDPFRKADCTTEVDGACAVLVTSLANARQMKQPPAVIEGAAYVSGERPGLDMSDDLLWDNLAINYTKLLSDQLWKSAGLGPKDVDFAEIYDCFSSVVLIGLEGLGLTGYGESGEFVRAGETGLHGQLPVNTNGGLLCEGYLHGMNTVAEAVLQIQGRGEQRQVPKANVGVVTSSGQVDGSALVLRRD